MTHREILDYYSQTFSEDARIHQGVSRFEYLRTQEILSRYLRQPTMNIVDIGCGTGAYSFWLAAQGHKVWMLDMVEQHITLA